MREQPNQPSVDDVIITEQLLSRPSRAPDWKMEAAILATLARETAERPSEVLQKLTDCIVAHGIAPSAGISLLEGDHFRWDALSGIWAHFRDSELPISASPCGVVIARNEVLLFERPDLVFSGPPVEPEVAETLLVPFHLDARPIGTLWVVSHEGGRRFDREDKRLLTNLSQFAASAFQIRVRTRELAEHRDLLRATMDASTDMIQVFRALRDDAGEIVDFEWLLNNHASESRYGEVRGERLLEKNPGVVREGIFDTFKQVTETGITQQNERHYVHEQFDGWFLQTVVKLDDGVATTTKDITAWKASQMEVLRLNEEVARARLHESEARLAAVFEALPVGVHVADRDGTTLLTNANLRRFLPNGTIPSRDPERGDRWRAWDADRRLIPPSEFPGSRSSRGETVVPGIEMLYRDDDGREIWTSVSSVPIRNEHGEITGQVGVISDIDVLKRTAEALRESEERLREFGEASQNVLWIRDADTLQWTYLTPAFEAIYGLKVEQVLAGRGLTQWLDLVVEEDRARVTAEIDRVRRGESITFEYRVRRPDGEMRWLRDTDFPIRTADGRVERIGGIGEDITHIKQAQHALERSEERLRSAVEVGKIGMWDWDVRTGETTWSDEHFRMEGYEVGEVKPSYERWLERVHPDDRSAAQAALRTSMHERTDYAHEFRSLHPDQTVHWLSARGRFFYDEREEPTRMVGAMIDVTDRRLWEDRQQTLLAELQHRVRNILAVIRSLIRRTHEPGQSAEEFIQHLEGRIDALARTQVLLTRGAGAGVDLELLILDELTAQAARRDSVVLDGPPVALPPKVAEVLTLAVHELATNAVKYGALSGSEGLVTIHWHEEQRAGQRWLLLRWIEEGVHVVQSAPRRQGFGTELITRRIPYELQGRGSLNLRPGGIVCELEVPLIERASILQTDVHLQTTPDS
ncbi:PAS domain-containing protein [Sphingomonas jatrophae]|uniref:histidine kinase n=1 Tax=Sphingomonas jatrophae TaxID=1166337 RepID=A0A1I6JND1_9SPHN|nr:PAS domain-containing protein [Sphingomonas jatrophae]SFR80483.1 PAS domain S-box-containing protein [Sphingomonas jatrophae]